MRKPLIIVESPAKAIAIARFLGENYTVLASGGHIADLPSGEIGVHIFNDFTPSYALTMQGCGVIETLQEAVDRASDLYIATDDDREGEMIAADLIRYLKTNLVAKRMVFHEVTPQAIRHAIQNPRPLDGDLIRAAVTRRILDRLYGYSISPVLWETVGPCLSAGRVQSPALRLVVEREHERMMHGSAGYWQLDAITQGEFQFKAKLLSVDGQRLAKSRDFTDKGELRDDIGDQVVVANDGWINALANELTGAQLLVRDITHTTKTTAPRPPYTTITLLQDASSKLGMRAARTTHALQFLYNDGFITYPRTDNVSTPADAMLAIRAAISDPLMYGPRFLSTTPRDYPAAATAQSDKHAILPKQPLESPEGLRGRLTKDQFAIYEMIWQRTLASQMTDHVTSTRTVHLECMTATSQPRCCVWSASETTVLELGFRRAYEEAQDEDLENTSDESASNQLGALQINDAIGIGSLRPTAHATAPKPRFTEATLMKALEESAIGRPSTYAAIMRRINDIEYVRQDGRELVPTWRAFSVIKLLKQHFANLIDLEFTAEMESRLDDIANGVSNPQAVLEAFYFGTPDAGDGLQELLRRAINTATPDEINCHRIGTHTATGEEINVRVGRYGPYVQCATTNRSIPKFMAPADITVARAMAMLAAPPNGAWRPE